MKKIFLAVLLSAGLFSCSNDNDNPETFFDYAVGDVWAYKYYNRNAQGEFIASSSIDTVKIVGTQVFDGETYFDFETTTYSAAGLANSPTHDYMRVDESGHLVNPDGVLEHPGTDLSFTENLSMGGYGYRVTQLHPEETIEVEAQLFQVYNYEQYYVPYEQSGVEGISSQNYYSPGVGKVLQRSRYYSSEEMGIEYRLEYHN